MTQRRPFPRPFACFLRTLALLAVLSQAMFPLAVMASWQAVAGTICTASGDGVIVLHSDGTTPKTHDCGTCPVCQVRTHADVATLPAPVTTTIQAPRYHHVAERPGRIAQPRAPPLYRAHARSPPTLC